MKKLFKILGISIVAIFVLLLVLPSFLKGKINNIAKKEMNKMLNAETTWGDMDLSLVRNFPNASAGLHDFTIVGKAPFAGDTLASVKEARVVINILSLFGDNIEINKVIVDEPNINLLINKDGKANWDIYISGTDVDSTEETEDDSSESSTGLNLDEVSLNDGKIVYNDDMGNMNILANNINISLSGGLQATQSTIKTKTSIGDFTFAMDGSEYASNIGIGSDLELEMNSETGRFDISKGNVKINELTLKALGYFQASDKTTMDISLATANSDFKNIIDLIPQDYMHYFEGVTTSGTAEIKVEIKGEYEGENYPAIAANIDINNGEVKYKDLPSSIDNINAKANITKAQGDLNLLIVDVPTIKLSIANNPISGNFTLKTPMTDPYFNVAVNGKVNLDDLKKAIPLEGTEINGKLSADLNASGNYSSIEKEQYDKVKTDGRMTLSDFVYTDKSFTSDIKIPTGSLVFSTTNISLQDVNVNIGKSDCKIEGGLSNFYPYIFDKKLLTGNLNLNSDYLDLNELSNLSTDSDVESTVATTKTSDTSATAIKIPQNINFILSTNIRKADYQNLELENITGNVYVKNGIADMRSLSMSTLGGLLKITGAYENTNEPKFNMNFNVKDMSMSQAATSISTLAGWLPIGKRANGNFSLNMDFSGDLDENMSPVLSTLNGKGTFSSSEITFATNQVITNVLGKVLKNDKFSNGMKIKAVSTGFTLENGNLILPEFTANLLDQTAAISGKVGIDQTMDMNIDLDLDRAHLSDNINSLISKIPNSDNINTIPIGVNLSGDMKSPKISLDTKAAENIAKEQIKEAAKDKITNFFKKEDADESKESDSTSSNGIKEKAKDVLNNLFK
ncbi:MAG: AsmA-like C-terminal region-containing protein [Bacteroidales bacterium]